MFWLGGLSLSLLSAVSFGILSNVPLRTLPAVGLVGMSGWAIYRLATLEGLAASFATFLGSTFISLASQTLSVRLRVPATNFSVAGIIVLVPGSTAYKSMLAFINGDYLGGVTLGAQTSLLGGAIAAGLILGLSLFRLWKGFVSRYARNARTRAKTD
ncbi:threonine/serine exporter family protein [Brevibacillus humidisoli]|uniref:threonine/serine exporter family protein n=1 Tax=Brevibacillus humidisoli TaxID=2895522 RepID=UPI001E49D116|nr:threonine/serine exporter family protein [Brevibacillus humidisoli]UFJ40556.1 threonine/serine exporter family protein [Brevibacillus humidisoli]